MTLPSKRRGGKRRTVNPMPLPGREGGYAEPRDDDSGAPVRRGPQHRLCQRTACCACYALWWRKHKSGPVDWTTLPELDPGLPNNASHHEPEGYRSDDDDTVPLCDPHHTHGPFARHAAKVGPKRFWAFFDIDYTEPRDEMRRRVKERRR